MKKKIAIYLFTIHNFPLRFLCSLWLIYFFLFAGNLYATSYILSPSNIRIEKGDTFTVNVELSDVVNTRVSDCYLNFDSSLVKIEELKEGTNSKYSWFAGPVETSTIKITTGINGGEDPVSGSWNVAIITIKAIKSGISDLKFDPRTRIGGPGGVNIPYIPYNSTITIVPLDHFVIDVIPSPQLTGREFQGTITGFDKNNNVKTAFSENVELSCISGDISPATITFSSGIWKGSITISNPPNGGTETITVSVDSLISQRSNPFLILHDNNKEAIVSTDCGIILNLSPNTLGTDSIISIAIITELPPEVPTSTLKMGDTFLDINAYDQNGESLGTTSLLAPATITISYNDIDQDGWVDGSLVWEEELFVSQYENGIWNALPSVVDTIKNSVSASLPHLSLFSLEGSQTTGSITSISCDASGYLGKNDTFTVTLIGEKRGKASFSVNGILGTVSMNEVEDGKYIGIYTIKEGDNVLDGTITGYLTISTMTYSLISTNTITCDTTPPEITSIYPQGGSYVRETVTITILVYDNISGIGSISIYWDNYLLRTNTGNLGTYTVIWDTTKYPEETHNLWSLVVDMAKNYATSNLTYPITIDNTKPSPATITSITNPKAGGSLDIVWNPSDDKNMKGYIIYYGTSSKVWTRKLNIGSLSTYRLTGLINNIPWYISFSAIDKAGNESLLSNEALGTPTGILTTIRIESQDGKEAGDIEISADDTIALFLMGYDQEGGMIGYITGTWSIKGDIGSLSQSYGTSTVFDPKVVGIGTICATDGSWTDATGLITVLHGTPTALFISPESATLTADDTFFFTAIAKDENNNTWTVTAIFTTDDPIGTMSANIYYPGRVGTWIITGTYSVFFATSTVIVSHGKPSSLAISALSTVTTNVGFNLTIIAYDRNKNTATTFSGTATVSNITNSINPCIITIKGGTGTAIYTISQSPIGGKDIITVFYDLLTATKAITVYINSQQGGTVTGKDTTIVFGTLSVNFIVNIATSSTLLKELPGVVSFAGIVYDIELFDEQGNRVATQTGEMGTVCIYLSYPDKDNDGLVDERGIKEEDLTIYHFEKGIWIALKTTVNGTENIVWAYVAHFSTFTLGGTPTVKLPALDLKNVIVYPNPCRIYKGYRHITFGNLTEQATIKIFNIAGEEIERLEKDDNKPTYIWNIPRNLASSVYIYFITNDNGQKKMGKLAIVK